MKTIKKQIFMVVAAMILAVSIVLGGVSSYLNYQTAVGVLENSIGETAAVASSRIAAELEVVRKAAIESGSQKEIYSYEMSDMEKQYAVNSKVVQYGFYKGNVIKPTGIGLDGADYSSFDFFKTAIKGETIVSSPLLDPKTKRMVIYAAAPVWEYGFTDTKTVGVVTFSITSDVLNNLVREIKIGNGGFTYIIDKTGTNVADVDDTLVGVENSIVEAEADASLKDIAVIENKMVAGEKGAGTYRYAGQRFRVGYAPIAGTDGWSIGVAASQNDFMLNFYYAIGISAICVVVFIILGMVVAGRFAKNVSDPIVACSKRIEQLGLGDISTPVLQIDRKDETGALMNSTKKLIDDLNMILTDIGHKLGNVAAGDLTVAFDMDYPGDFVRVEDAIKGIVCSLNGTISQIEQAAEQVAAGAQQVSDGAQSLSQGTSEQAGTIEELSATVNEINSQIGGNAKNAENASTLSSENAKLVSDSNVQMQEMIKAMTVIGTRSSEIEKIIKTIDDIAFQTNILALNAAVEVARAGEAGKGFAVVADEVRNLAQKSAQAAKHTTELIGNAIQAVGRGVKIADATADSLGQVVVKANAVNNLIDEIARASAGQAEAVNQVNIGVEQIAQVIHANSATAEQSAAASEELSGQAALLKELVGKFQLDRDPEACRDFASDALLGYEDDTFAVEAEPEDFSESWQAPQPQESEAQSDKYRDFENV